MLFNIPLLEWIGYTGSVIVAVSLTMSSIKKLRWYNLTGAMVFSFYGFAIGAYPVGLLNLFIVVADSYYIYKMYFTQEQFKAIRVDIADSYMNYFIYFNQNSIKEFFPLFDIEQLKQKNKENAFVLLLLRNATVAGVFIGIKEKNTLAVQLDFVSVEYRDLKPGDYIYKKNIELFKEQSITQITGNTDNAQHKKYLLKMGFEQQGNNDFVKSI